MHDHPLSEQIDYLARTIYGEARGETDLGKQAVGWVIKNRANRGGWWGDDIVCVCVKPWQFSCWNENDLNRDKLLQVTLDDEVFAKCYSAALLVLLDHCPDASVGSTHYHTRAVSPDWAKNKTPVGQIGSHLFYNDIQ